MSTPNATTLFYLPPCPSKNSSEGLNQSDKTKKAGPKKDRPFR